VSLERSSGAKALNDTDKKKIIFITVNLENLRTKIQDVSMLQNYASLKQFSDWKKLSRSQE
jgi:hypothetical protein